jgi:bacterioferritin
MKAPNQAILDALNESVSAHLTAIEQYASQAALFARSGYSKLAGRATADAEEERTHLAKLFGRIVFYDSAAVFTHKGPDYPTGDLIGILSANLFLENAAAEIERRGIQTARQFGDEGTASIFTENLEGSEASVLEIEAIQSQIAAMTLGQYLSTQI